MGKDWISGAIEKKGALRKTLGAKKGKDISPTKLKKAAEGDFGPKTAKRAKLAQTLKSFTKK